MGHRLTDETLAALRGFAAPGINARQEAVLESAARSCRCDAVMMTGIAGSGHPAGALSSMDIFVTLAACADLTPENADDPSRDRVVVSHGHTSAGVYAVLASRGFFDRDEAIANFRRAGSPFQGHIERAVPGVDWGTGNLGQGLAAGVGFAIANRACGRKSRVFVVMGDGGQTKGQIAEARRIAVKEGLSSLTALIDANGIQISGTTTSVMPTQMAELWAADGWEVMLCDGHSFSAIYDAIKRAEMSPVPSVIICRTTMGRGVSFMEGTPEYHGKAASGDKLAAAIRELGGDPAEIERLKALRSGPLPSGRRVVNPRVEISTGSPRTYTDADKKDGRGAFGTALADVARTNAGAPIIAFDCDLAGSVKLDSFAKVSPRRFIETGIQEHATATAAGAAATAGAISVWADFGVFGIDEVYNQQRLNDINEAPLKTVLTHIGLDVGEDGMTHQCIDYVGTYRSFFGTKLVVPADANEADRATRWMLEERSPVCLAVGRGVHPVITREDGTPFFGGDRGFEYGRIDVLRDGSDVVIMAMGWMTVSAIRAHDILLAEGIKAKVLSCSSPLAMKLEELAVAVGRGPLVTVEDHAVDSGMGSIAAMLLGRAGAGIKIVNLGVTRYGDSGPASDVVARMGLAPADIAAAARAAI